jgi:hypothetical protein
MDEREHVRGKACDRGEGKSKNGRALVEQVVDLHASNVRARDDHHRSLLEMCVKRRCA